MRFLKLFLILLMTVQASAGVITPPSVPQSFGSGSLPLRSGPVITCVGDSECAQGTVSNPATSTYYSSGYQVGTNGNSILGWLNNVSGGAFALDFVNQAYPGNIGGLYYVRFLTQGSGCPASTSVTITPSTPTGSPVNTPSTLSFTTTSGGLTPPAGTVLYEPVGSSQGSGYISTPTLTLSQTCTTPPTFGYALTGYGDWGVNGDTSAGWLPRVQNEVCAAKPDWAINIIGTNDLVAGVSAATINANVLAGLQAEEACGIRPILFPILPRTNGISSWTAPLDRVRIRINAWRRNLAMLTRQSAIASTTGLSTYPGLPYPVIFVDIDHLWTNATNSCTSSCSATTAIGDAIANMTYDGLHQSPLGAFTEALATWQEIRGLVASVTSFMPNSQNDYYDVTSNPAGNMLGTYGLFLGTTGTATAPCTTSSGTAAGWNISESGNAGMSCVGILETSRTDGLSGQRQVVTISDTGGGHTDKVTLATFVNFSTSYVSAGDQVYLEGDIDLSNLSQVEDAGCQLTETNTVVQGANSTFSGVVSGSSPIPDPNLSSSTIAQWHESSWLTDFGTTSAGSFKIHVRTPPITVRAGDTGWTEQCNIYLNGSSGTATATAKFGNIAVRKILTN